MERNWRTSYILPKKAAGKELWKLVNFSPTICTHTLQFMHWNAITTIPSLTPGLCILEHLKQLERKARAEGGLSTSIFSCAALILRGDGKIGGMCSPPTFAAWLAWIVWLWGAGLMWVGGNCLSLHPCIASEDNVADVLGVTGCVLPSLHGWQEQRFRQLCL